MTKEKRLALYEKALNELADWDLPDSLMSATDDNGASVLWARELLTRAGRAPKSRRTS